MKIELRKLSDSKPYPSAPRQNDAAVDAAAASIKQVRFRQPFVVGAEGVIVCGRLSQRSSASREAGTGVARSPSHTGGVPTLQTAYAKPHPNLAHFLATFV
jgi:hypothetical protein